MLWRHWFQVNEAVIPNSLKIFGLDGIPRMPAKR
jgi:hypothetical protein